MCVYIYMSIKVCVRVHVLDNPCLITVCSIGSVKGCFHITRPRCVSLLGSQLLQVQLTVRTHTGSLQVDVPEGGAS